MAAPPSSSLALRLLVPLAALAVVVPHAAVPDRDGASAQTDGTAEVRYAIDSRGDVETDVGSFAAHVAQTLADDRGWSMGGALPFVRVDGAPEVTIWIASPEEVDAFHPACSDEFSCRVGDHVLINDDAWQQGTDAWPLSLRDYRHMVVNHELGHWFGLDHTDCPGAEELAPLMMQQSKGLDGCVANPWPTGEERRRVAADLGVAVLGIETPAMAATPAADGYWVLEADGEVLPFGAAADLGDQSPLAALVDLAALPAGGAGYWVLDRAGGVFTFGDAGFHGSVPGLRGEGHDIPLVPVADIEPAPSGDGYWVLDESGGVFSFGDARFQGSVPGLRREGHSIPRVDVVDLVATASGDGYWVLDESGGVFTFGDARFRGSVPALRRAGHDIPRQPVVAMGASPTGDGYAVADAAGGVFTFGDARFHGSVPGLAREGADLPDRRETDLVLTGDGQGYWILDEAGEVYPFGDAPDLGDDA